MSKLSFRLFELFTIKSVKKIERLVGTFYSCILKSNKTYLEKVDFLSFVNSVI